ncbi:MAG: PAS domain-containing protein [Taibaiella sp.]|nr:PAS domain-containing protein [Taibaiella sp.]
MASNILSDTKGIKKIGVTSGYPIKPITETITNGFFTVDKQWTVKYWNKAAEKLLKVAAKDVLGKNLWEQFADIIPLEFYGVYYKAFQQDTPIHFEEYWGEMGAWFDVVTYYCDDLLSVSFKSCNKPVHAEEELKVVNELYRFITKVTNDCLWEWDLQTKELFWIDGGHKRVFGFDVENALIPQSFWESCIHPDDRVRILTRLNKIITDGAGNVWEDEYRFRKVNGDYAYVQDRGHIIYDAENNATRMVGATQDITTRKLAEIKLLESERKLLLIARQPVKESIPVVAPTIFNGDPNRFAAALAHEVRNPLTNINLSAEMLGTAMKGDDERAYVDIILRSSKRINNLIIEFLKYQKEDEITAEKYSIKDLLDEALEMTKDRLTLKHVAVKKDYSIQDDKIILNRPKTLIALINIIINAIDAMEAGKGELKLLTMSIDGKYVVQIEDNGCGISKVNLKYIFEAYYTNKPGGLGLGLATTYNILRANNVEIKVESEEGRGTRFILLFDKKPLYNPFNK